MKKLLSIILLITTIFSMATTVLANREFVGETVVKDNMLFINGNSIPAAQLPNEFVYLKIDDLEWYGFDVKLEEKNEKKIYTITRNKEKRIHPKEVPSNNEPINVYTTNAEVYIDSDVPANVFELENGAVVIQSDEFAKYGTYNWNVETHKISITFKDSNEVLPFQPFHNAIGVNDINEIKHGVIVENTEKKCADIEYNDLTEWLDDYWNFNYERVVAPLAAFDLSGNYIKLWNEDKSKSYIVYSNGGIIAGKYGKGHEIHGVIKQNYVWYLPVMSNSRGILNSADTKLNFTYFREIEEIEYKGHKQREFTPNDEIEIPEENLLYTDTASDWAKYEIDKAAAYNLMVYDLSEEYTKSISRLEFCRLAYQLIATEFSPYTDSRMGIGLAMDRVCSEKQVVISTANDFSDCSDGCVKTLTAMGIINGIDNGTFAPDEFITREQAATILYRTAAFLGNKTIIKPTYDKMYEDENIISDWAISSVSSMKAMNIMKGVSEEEFNPRGNYTVEQAIATMVRLYECY